MITGKSSLANDENKVTVVKNEQLSIKRQQSLRISLIDKIDFRAILVGYVRRLIERFRKTYIRDEHFFCNHILRWTREQQEEKFMLK